ncbi:MAG: peptidyl-tRNA hydrolase Pth2 [Candidatus Diapherotrites archaeon]|nr:peptidyl-tRNA hydrolase Pth2 [Candidatus Diapherotrites archaeon]
MGLKQAIIVRTDLHMGRGKIAAQCAHASVMALNELPPAIFESWNAGGMKKIVLKVGSKQELLELYQKTRRRFPSSIVHDAGLTQVNPGEPTCIAIGPAEEKEIDIVTGGLRLL